MSARIPLMAAGRRALLDQQALLARRLPERLAAGVLHRGHRYVEHGVLTR
ncbi:Uncharacterised protein [Bordetella pertussis]|nr:Uncharacterised protein [Bordetella pertussis]